MADKSLGFDAVQAPEESNVNAEEQAAILAAIRRGEEAADASRFIPHEAVKKQVAGWTSEYRGSQ